MVWNVDSQGPQRSFRIIQKRGVVLDEDDFLPVRSTYPEHPSSSTIPKAATIGEVRQQRRES